MLSLSDLTQNDRHPVRLLYSSVQVHTCMVYFLFVRRAFVPVLVLSDFSSMHLALCVKSSKVCLCANVETKIKLRDTVLLSVRVQCVSVR